MDFGLEDDIGGGGRRQTVSPKATKSVGQLGDHLSFVDVDTFAIQEHVPGAHEYDAFFVDVKHGDYAEVWGIKSRVPYNDATAYRIK